MSRRVLLLRAVNVGGAQLPMARLRAMAEELGATDVTTYIASGNLICTPPGRAADFDRALEQAVQRELGAFREVVSRTPEQLAAALAAHPFDVTDPKYSYISFLVDRPAAAAVTAAQALPTGEDRWQVVGSELHIRYADGAGHEQMRTATLMKRLGVAGTARNLTTVGKLIELAGC